MSPLERILHAILFEIGFLSLAVPISILITGHPIDTLSVALIGVSLLTVLWNYVFNLGFDWLYGAQRLARGLRLRIWHGVSFELGLLLITTPFLMWQLQLPFWPALLLDIGFALFCMVYSVLYNWGYDLARDHFLNPPQPHSH
ncbi:PACE efflux transporter [Ferrimonas gelatinilytica]